MLLRRKLVSSCLCLLLLLLYVLVRNRFIYFRMCVFTRAQQTMLSWLTIAFQVCIVSIVLWVSIIHTFKTKECRKEDQGLKKLNKILARTHDWKLVSFPSGNTTVFCTVGRYTSHQSRPLLQPHPPMWLLCCTVGQYIVHHYDCFSRERERERERAPLLPTIHNNSTTSRACLPACLTLLSGSRVWAHTTIR